MNLHGFEIPPSPYWNDQQTNAVGTPGGGLLYLVGRLTAVKYVAPTANVTKPEYTPLMVPRKCITHIECDPDWSLHRYFAALDVEDNVYIWDLDRGQIIKGHRGHQLGVGRTRAQQHHHHQRHNSNTPARGALCYLNGQRVLSSIDSLFVLFSVASNTFRTIKINQLFDRDPVVLMKGSPYDENIVACGSKRGLVTIINIDQKSIVHKFSAHSQPITSLAWQQMTFSGPSEPLLVVPAAAIAQSAPPSSERPIAQAHHSKEARLRGPPKTIVDADDAFDIYDFDDGADEFGVISRATYAATTTVPVDKNNKPEQIAANADFNFVEACESLVDDMLRAVPAAMDDSCAVANDFEKLSLSGGSDIVIAPEDATLTQQAIDAATASAKLSETDHSSDESFVHVEGGAEAVRRTITFIASASGGKEATIWLWNVDAGGSTHKIQLKAAAKSHKDKKIYVIWPNEHELVANTPNGDLVQYQLSTAGADTIASRVKDGSTFTAQGVNGLFMCPPSDGADASPIIWTQSNSHQMQCTLLSEPPQQLAFYSTLPIGMPIISECPHDPNKIAFAGTNRRINVLNVSNFTPTNVSLTHFTNGIQSKVFYVSWHPAHENLLAFSTEDGRIGVYDLNKPSSHPAIVPPFTGQPIYQISWAKISQGADKPETERYVLLACADGQLRCITENGDNKYTSVQVPMEEPITSVSANEQYVSLGTKNGYVVVCKPYIEQRTLSQIVFAELAGTKYISECAWNPINPAKVAAASFDGTITIFTVDKTKEADGIVKLKAPAGVTHIKWSGQNEHMLVSTDLDGLVCVWNTQTMTRVAEQHFSSSIYAVMFLPTDENYVMCVGRKETVVLFDIRATEPLKRVKYDKIMSESYVWGTLLQNDAQQLMKNEKTNNRRVQKRVAQQKAAVAPPVVSADGDESDVGIIYESDSPLNQSVSECVPHASPVEAAAAAAVSPSNNALHIQYSTICYLTNKEFNKDALKCLLLYVEDERSYASTMNCRLFTSRADLRSLLAEELKNHKLSRTESVAHVLIPSLLCELQVEIHAKALDGRLTESDLAIAPKVSYLFWKECCQKYCQQMLRNGFPLQALPYIQSQAEVKSAIDALCNKHYFREAWILARLNMDTSDPIFVDILEKWISWLEANGNLDGAALIAATTGQVPRALGLLGKRRNKPDEVVRIMEILQTKVPIPFAYESAAANVPQ